MSSLLLAGAASFPRARATSDARGRRRSCVTSSANDGRRGVLVCGGILGAQRALASSGGAPWGVSPALAADRNPKAKSEYSSLYELEVQQYGKPVSLSKYENKVSVVVNVASV